LSAAKAVLASADANSASALAKAHTTAPEPVAPTRAVAEMPIALADFGLKLVGRICILKFADCDTQQDEGSGFG
jgi:hypothetical protein